MIRCGGAGRTSSLSCMSRTVNATACACEAMTAIASRSAIAPARLMGAVQVFEAFREIHESAAFRVHGATGLDELGDAASVAHVRRQRLRAELGVAASEVQAVDVRDLPGLLGTPEHEFRVRSSEQREV